MIAATVDVGLTRERFRRAFVVALPTALWLIWYLGWGRYAENFVSFHNFSTLPGYVGDGFSSSLSTLLGLAVPRDEAPISSLDWGRPLLVIALAACGWRIWHAGIMAFNRRLWAVLAMGLAFWSLTGLNASFFGQATSGRYQYMGVIFIVLIAAELLRGVAVRRWVVGTVLRRLAGGDARELLLTPRQRQRPRRDRAEGEGRARGARAHPWAGGGRLRAHRGQLRRRLPRGDSRRAVLLGDRRLRLAGLHARRAGVVL